MKKVILFTMFVTLLLSGCAPTICDAGYDWHYVIKNETDKMIVLISADPAAAIALAPGEIETVHEQWGLGPCNSTTPMEDRFTPDEYIPHGYYGGNDPRFDTILIDNEDIGHEILRRKYWNYETSGNYYCTYTLTVTEELLEEFMTSEGE